MDWILQNYDTIALCLLIADKVASATPPSLVIWGIPIGLWDNQIVAGVKKIFKSIFIKEGKP